MNKIDTNKTLTEKIEQVDEILKKVGTTKEEMMSQYNMDFDELYKTTITTQNIINYLEEEFSKDD